MKHSEHSELVQSFQGNFDEMKKAEIICHFLSVCVRQFPSPTEDPTPQRSTSVPAEPRDARAAPDIPEAAGH